MSYQSDIVAAIQADSPLRALIGDKVFADAADGSAEPPYLVYQVVTANGETALDGSRGLIFPLIQFTAWAKGKSAAIDVISKLATAIEGKNLPGASNVSLGYSNEQSTYDGDTKLFGELIEYRASANRN